ncbi:MAG: bifunctional riboflavin kinase/FAD synthetase [Dongiaceae bacterium]
MRLFRHYTEVPVEARGAVVALGNFDGVHRGHQAVVGEAARLAGELGVSHAVLTFEPHPREFFRPAQPPFRLTPFRIKARQFEAMGVDSLFVLTFDAELAGKSAEAFVVEVLGEGLGVAHVVVGYDFVFGHGRRGDAALLRELGAIQGFGTTVVDPARAATGEPFSSTRAREALAAGDPLAAAAQLGRPWEIEGRVERGDRRGHGLGFPTANLPLGDYLQPALGIYAIEAGIDEGRGTTWRGGVGYVGRRPTFAGERVLLEAHLFDFAGDLYGRHLRVAFVDFIRADATFDDVRQLRAQIAADAAEARRRLAAYDGPPPGAVVPLPPRPARSRPDDELAESRGSRPTEVRRGL